MIKKPYDFSKKIIEWLGSTQSLVAHTTFFICIFIFGFSGVVSPDYVFALTTNILSIEAIYLAIFIQMSINKHSDDLEEVSEDIEELQEDVEEISEDIDEIQEDVEELSEDDEADTQEEIEEEEKEAERFKNIENTLQTLLKEISDIKNHKH